MLTPHTRVRSSWLPRVFRIPGDKTINYIEVANKTTRRHPRGDAPSAAGERTPSRSRSKMREPPRRAHWRWNRRVCVAQGAVRGVGGWVGVDAKGRALSITRSS